MEAQSPLTTVEKAALLIEVDLFREVPSDALAELAALMEESWHAPGDVLLEPEVPEGRLSVLVAGAVRVTRGEEVVCDLGRGDAFGLLSALGLETDETVTAIATCRLLSVAPDEYLDVLADSTAFALANLRALGRRLQACGAGLSAPVRPPAGDGTR